MDRLDFRVPMRPYTFVVPDGVSLLYVSGCGGGGSGTVYGDTSGAEGGGAGEYGIRIPMAVTPGDHLTVVVGWGGAKNDSIYDTTGQGNGGPSFVTPNGPAFAGGYGANPTGGAGVGQGGHGGGAGGFWLGGNQNLANGVPANDPPQDFNMIGFAPAPYHFGGAGGAGTNAVASQPSSLGYGGSAPNNNRGGFPATPGDGALIGGFTAFCGSGGGASIYGPGGNGSDAVGGAPHHATSPGAGGGGAASGSGRPTSQRNPGNGGPGFIRIEWRRVQ